jgi:NAD+-dependent protein deacetylase SIR2
VPDPTNPFPVPDFRSSTGLFKSLKKQHNLKSSGKDLFDASVYKDDTSTESFHDMVRSLSEMTKTAEPTPFHHLLATLAHDGRLLRLYSQNVDGIDTSLEPLATQVPLNRKAPWPKTIQLHGNLQKMVCSKCHKMSDLDPELFDGPEAPTCDQCVENDNLRTEHAGKRSHGIGRLRPRMVLYNEHNPDDEAIGAVVKADLRTRPDALIVVGTTLKVPGVKRIVKEMCGVVRGRRDGLTVWINMDSPPVSKDYEWDLIVKGPCDHVANFASIRHWYEPKEEEPVTDEQVQKVMSETRVEVVVRSPSKKNRMDELSLPTPTSSRSCSVPPQQPVSEEQAEKKETPKRKRQIKLKDGLPAKPKQTTKRVKKAGPPTKRASKKAPPKENNTISFKTSKAGIQESGKPANPLHSVSPSDAKNNSLPISPFEAKDMILPPISQLLNSFPVSASQGPKMEANSAPQSPVFSPPPSRRNSSPQMDVSFVLN